MIVFLFNLKENNYLPLNLEMAATEEMQEICLKVLPFACCIVPEKREELTTEGGLDVIKNSKKLRKLVSTLISKGIRVSLFVDPCQHQIRESQKIGTNAVEIHTGQYADAFEKGGLRFSAFNLDPNFKNCVDGLIIGDLHKLANKKRERYLHPVSSN